MPYDILFLAVIAGLVLYRLWSVLGQRHGDEPERPNPFMPPAAPPKEKTDTESVAGILSSIKQIVADGSLLGGLQAIKAIDPNFDEKKFLQTARANFSRILADFAKGDMKDSAALLDAGVRAHFEKAIEERQRSGQILEIDLVGIKEADCLYAKVENGTARIHVQFISRQKTVLRDNFGRIVGGGDKAEELTDQWVFTRDVSKPDGAWILVETRA